MKRLFFLLLLGPLLSAAQAIGPRFENDTLTTSGGYKIYKGQTLQLANGSSDAGYFRYVKFHTNMARNDTYILQGSSILVKSLRQFRSSPTGSNSIRISGIATRKDNSKMDVDIIMDFEKAIFSPDAMASELTVPEQFRTRPAPAAVAAEPKKTAAPEETKRTAVTEDTKKTSTPDDLKKMLVADEIKKLFDLYKAGALTKEEYETRKKKLLEQ